MDFTGQHVIITGGSTGIGRATGARIAGLGGTVTLIARRAEVLKAACAEIGERADWIAADVGVKAQILEAIDTAIQRHGPIDGLFLNAGCEGMFSRTPEYTDEAFEEVMRVNAFSVFWALRHALPAMMARGKGSILVTGSLAAATGMVGNTGYSAAKHAAAGLAMAVAMEAAPSGVRCNLINPGFIDTQLMSEAPEAFKAVMIGRVPQKRIGTPEEAAHVAAFLLSDDSSHVTAQKLAIDGGLLGTLMIET
jgi:NAD(P)-dependent dehydrogenase (short-subunit alcohol dehydrogenase family)